MVKGKLYPLRFKTIFKDKIWGGQKIHSVLKKDFGSLENCGETWEISGVSDNVSTVANGSLKGQSLTDLISTYQAQLVGESVYNTFGSDFPLLIKFIDANQDLSIQVHPDNALAKQRHNCFGKSEMWYVIQADEGSSLISGFSKELNKEEYLHHFNSGRLDEILNVEATFSDDVYDLPAGRVHTIGKGNLIAEIQQSSDITYRIYDFDRKDSEGNLRELHVEEALDAIDFKKYDSYKTDYDKTAEGQVELVKSTYFETDRLLIEESLQRDLSIYDSFVIFIVLEGEGELLSDESSLHLRLGDAILVPACVDSVTLNPTGKMKLLETRVPSGRVG